MGRIEIPLGFVAALLWSNLALAFGPPKPVERSWVMAVLGDSISAATLADVPIPNVDDPEARVRLWHQRGSDSRLIFENKRTLSWASGQSIESHFTRLKRWAFEQPDSRPVEVINVAHAGDETRDLPGQVERLIAMLRRDRHHSIQYVALTIGSNDACKYFGVESLPEEQIRADLIRAIRRLSVGVLDRLGQREPLRILLVGVPRIPNLGTPGFRRARTIFGLSCGTVRDTILRECNPLTVWKTAAEYRERLDVVEQVNHVLKSTATEMAAELPGVDVVYSDRLFQLEIPLGALAADCFHPARWGQEQIANETWKDQPWFQ